MPKCLINVERYAQLPSDTERDRVIATHERIRDVVEGSDEMDGMVVRTLLQGSYANHTNTPKTSDVDIIVSIDGVWFDESSAPGHFSWDQHTRTQTLQRQHADLRVRATTALRAYFGSDVDERSKVIHVRATSSGSRKPADVLPVIGYRLAGANGTTYNGIMFWPRFGGTPVSNFPEQHRAELINKGRPERAGSNFKGIVRAVKTLRNELADRHTIDKSLAPSYWIEGLLTNVPDRCFQGQWDESLHEVLSWLKSSLDFRTQRFASFAQANRIRPLFGPNAWSDSNARQLIDCLYERAFVRS